MGWNKAGPAAVVAAGLALAAGAGSAAKARTGRRWLTGRGARYLYAPPTGPHRDLAGVPGVEQLRASVNTAAGGWDYPVQTTGGGFGATAFDDLGWYQGRDRVAVPNVAAGGGFRPSRAGDGHLVVIDTRTRTGYDFWRLCASATGVPVTCPGNRSPTSVGFVRAFSLGGNGAPGGGTASGLSGLAGDILPGELGRGDVGHALSVIVPASMMRPGPCTAAPADHSDGHARGGVFCEGAKLRLDPALAVEALPATPAARSILRALQRYGGIITDQSDCAHCMGFYSALAGPPPSLAGLDAVLHAHLWIYYRH